MKNKNNKKTAAFGKQEKGRKNYWLSSTGRVLTEKEVKELDKVLIRPKF